MLFYGLPGAAQVLNLESPTLAKIQSAIHDFKPNILYIWAGAGVAADTTTAPLQSIMLDGQDELLPEDLPELVAGHGIHGLVLNMVSEGIPQAEIRQHVPFLVRWSPGTALFFSSVASSTVLAGGLLQRVHNCT
jgi:hypothetical protein